MKPLGLYIHIPFCMKKCNYCDFLSFGGIDRERHVAYIDALCGELEYYAGKELLLDSVYIGGGTPSLLAPDLISRIMDKVHGCFLLTETVEISIESNPGQLDAIKLTAYKRDGINRLSIGAQSLDDEVLRFMGRIHNSDTFIRNFALAREAGFENISVDLMFAIPVQSLDIWLDSLGRTIDLGPEHISFYSLQIEEGTHFFALWEKDLMKAVGDGMDRKMYHAAVDMLKNRGYRHYEISNGAKPGYESRHNLKYWSMEEYLGVGLGAHSYVNGRRFSNETDLNKYLCIEERNFSECEGEQLSPWALWSHKNTLQDEMAEFLFTGLRKIEGISLSAFEARFGMPLTELYEVPVARHETSGLLEITGDNDCLRLTKKGIDLFNQVLVDFV